MANLIGKQLGNYHLVRLLGQGGFADVYLGEHIHLKTQAAIKVLGMRLDNNSLDGFIKEAQTIAHLEHPHIIRVLEFGVEPETGLPFLVMSYAPNGTLRHRYAPGTQVPLPDILLYVKQVASALQYAHNQKLIHRDVKPENMLLGRNGEVLLSDFGIALVTQSSRQQSTRDVVGTVAYMAPEQLQGKPSVASDQYALGIAVYEWLCGERPFKGTFIELFSQHTMVAPPPLQERFPFIPADVEQIVRTALAKEPQQRFSSVIAFANALEQACNAHDLFASDSPTLVKPLPGQTPPPPPGVTPIPLPPIGPPPQTPLPQQSGGTPVAAPSAGISAPQFTGSMSTIPYQTGTANSDIRPNGSQTTPQGVAPQSTGTTTSQFPPFQSANQSAAGQTSLPPQTKRAGLNWGSKILSIVALLVILLALSSYLFKFPPSPFSNGTGTQPTTVARAGNETPTSGSTTTQTTPTATQGQNTPDATSEATATPTTATNYSKDQLIYEAKDWSTWNSTDQWKPVNNGTLGCDGSGDNKTPTNGYATWAPETALPANYAVEAQIQIARATDETYKFGIIVRGDGNESGYEAGIIHAVKNEEYGAPLVDKALISIVDPHVNSISSTNLFFTLTHSISDTGYNVDNAVHTYRVEVEGNTVRLFLDKRKLLETTDNTYLDAGRVGLRCQYADLNVLTFKVIAL